MEELLDMVHQLRQELERLKMTVARLQGRVMELEQQT